MDEYEKNVESIKLAFEAITEQEPDLDKECKDFKELEEEEEADSCFPDEDAEDDEKNANEEAVDMSFPTNSNVDEVLKNNAQYYAQVRELYDEQQKIFWYVHDWCVKKRQNPDHPPLHVGIIGGAGTGKSRIINVLYELFQRELPSSGQKTENICAKLSFTGMAANNIDGRTYHSFYGLGHESINNDVELSEASKASARERLKEIEVV